MMKMPRSQMKQRADSFLGLYPSFMGNLLVCVALSNLKVRRTALNTLELFAQRLGEVSPALFDTLVVKLLGGLLSYLVVQFELHTLSELLLVRMVNPTANVVKASLYLLLLIVGEELPDALLKQNLLTSLIKWLGDGQAAAAKLRGKSCKCLDLPMAMQRHRARTRRWTLSWRRAANRSRSNYAKQRS